jgi:hypothetical protein
VKDKRIIGKAMHYALCPMGFIELFQHSVR